MKVECCADNPLLQHDAPLSRNTKPLFLYFGRQETPIEKPCRYHPSALPMLESMNFERRYHFSIRLSRSQNNSKSAYLKGRRKRSWVACTTFLPNPKRRSST